MPGAVECTSLPCTVLRVLRASSGMHVLDLEGIPIGTHPRIHTLPILFAHWTLLIRIGLRIRLATSTWLRLKVRCPQSHGLSLMPVAVARGKHWESDEVTLVSTRYMAPKLSTECFLLLPAKGKEILMILGEQLWVSLYKK